MTSEVSILASYLALLIAGLASSLHCIGMCGPILLGFSQAFADGAELTVEGRPAPRARRLLGDFTFYHAGRLWTYALLGALAAFAGQGLRHASTWGRWQQGGGILLAVVVIASGIALAGILPRLSLNRANASGGGGRGCFGRWGTPAGFAC